MTMFKKIFVHEFLETLKKPVLWILFAVVAFFAFQDSGNDIVGRTYINAFGQSWHNAALFIARDFAMLSLVSLLFLVYLVGRSVAKDFESNIHHFFFTTPLSKGSYLFGRFLGSFTASLLAFSGVIVGFLLGISGLEPDLFGPHQVQYYLFGYLVISLPIVLLLSSVFFSFATLTRNMFMTYVAGIGFLLLFGMTSGFIPTDVGLFHILADPTGLTYLSNITSDWTVTEINNQAIPLEMSFILNRVLWIGISLLILFVTWVRFELVATPESKKKKKGTQEEETLSEVRKYHQMPIPSHHLSYTFGAHLQQLTHLIWRETKRIIFHPAFLFITFAALQVMYGNFVANVGPNASNVYAVTSWYLSNISEVWANMLPILVFFGGMLVWKERDHNTDAYYNTLPLPIWMGYLSKLGILTAIILFYLFAMFAAGIFAQIVIFDYYEVELGLYAKQLLGIEFFDYLHIAVMVLFIQVLAGNKYLGFFLCALYYGFDIVVFQNNGFGWHLFHYGHLPGFSYSNLNGYGNYAEMLIWFRIYWLFPAAILAVITMLFWPRGTKLSFKERVKVALQQINTQYKISLTVLVLLLLGTGSFIYYNNHILNTRYSFDERLEIRANYERTYKEYEFEAQPTISDINLNVDLYPDNREVNVKGTYVLSNFTQEPISEIFVNLNDNYISETEQFSIDGARVTKEDRLQGVYFYTLDTPLQPGDSVYMDFAYHISIKGFSSYNSRSAVTGNGSYIYKFPFYQADFFPDIGYNVTREIVSNDYRASVGLPERDNDELLGDERYLKKSRSGLTTYEAVISTAPDQIAVSNGALVREWTENNRNYFHYKTEGKINDAIGIASGIYDVEEEVVNGVTLRVYYHPKHYYNIDNMMEGMQASVTYGSEHFGAYPYTNASIVEVNAASYPGSGTALSIPTTFIWQENGGFISNLEDPNVMDVAFSTASHEFAHQWWGHIVRPAFTPGLPILTESLSQYVRLMTLKEQFGEAKALEHLEAEQERYLRWRQRDTRGEVPMLKATQSYLAYYKGSVIFYMLQEYLGENRVNQALRMMVDTYGLKDTELYPTVQNMVDNLFEVTPDSLHYVIEDAFLNIVLYENEMTDVQVSQSGNEYSVTVEILGKKVHSDGRGVQTEVDMNDLIPIGITNASGELMYYQMHRLQSNSNSLQITLKEKPAWVNIDPKGILIERKRADNQIIINTESF